MNLITILKPTVKTAGSVDVFTYCSADNDSNNNTITTWWSMIKNLKDFGGWLCLTTGWIQLANIDIK